MKDRPILFRGPLVRAIIEGRKTVTRRPVMPPPKGDLLIRAGDLGKGDRYVFQESEQLFMTCPYGKPGDRLYCRETWAWSGDREIPEVDRVARGEVWFKADGKHSAPNIRWRPSIHMPRWASRLTLEITGVRVERVQDISRADAKAEGFWPSPNNGLESFGGRLYGNAEDAFHASWDATYKARGLGWDANPWVWVIDFKKVPADAGQGNFEVGRNG